MAFTKPTTVPFWAQLVAWQASTNYVVGQRVYNGANIYTCTIAGQSAGSGGPTGTGSGIVDGGVTWNYVAPVGGTAWSSGTAYTVGQRVTSGGSLFQCAVAGAGNSTVAPVYAGPPDPVQGPVLADGYAWLWLYSSSASIGSPTAFQQDIGWSPGGIPPAPDMNWLFYWILQWILWLRDITNQALTWTATQTFNNTVVMTPLIASDALTITANGAANAIVASAAGGGFALVANGTAGNTSAADFQGHGSAASVLIENPTGSGHGLQLTGSGGSGDLLHALGAAATTGDGVDVDMSSGTSGYAARLKGNTGNAPLMLTPQAGGGSAPTPEKGAIWYDSTANHYYGSIDGATWTQII